MRGRTPARSPRPSPGAARARGLLRGARPPRSGCTQPEMTARCSSAATGAGERSRRTPTPTCAGSTAASRSASVAPSSPRDHLGQLAPRHPFFRVSPRAPPRHPFSRIFRAFVTTGAGMLDLWPHRTPCSGARARTHARLLTPRRHEISDLARNSLSPESQVVDVTLEFGHHRPSLMHVAKNSGKVSASAGTDG
jgi:hypothetical protein